MYIHTYLPSQRKISARCVQASNTTGRSVLALCRQATYRPTAKFVCVRLVRLDTKRIGNIIHIMSAWISCWFP